MFKRAKLGRERDRGSRGSLLILVVVSLVLMVVLATTYLQIARVDRVATRQISSNNIDLVKIAIIEQLKKVLLEDLVDDTGTFFNPSEDDVTDPGAGDEPYDYPWTNSPPVQFEVFDQSGGLLGLADGGQNDDMWLASSSPDFSTPTEPFWPHITNLTGIFLSIPSNNPGAQPRPFESPINQNSFLRKDTDVLITGNLPSLDDSTTLPNFIKLGVDADGDGIDDSRWTWAPIRQISGISYVMGVRVVDLSAMVNANVALSQVDSSGNLDQTPTGIDAPFWNHPSELDLGTFIHALDPSEMMPALVNLLNFRTGNNALPTQGAIRDIFWMNVARFYGVQAPERFGVQNELELRFKNGLNNPDVKAGIEDGATGLLSFLRHNSGTSESDWTQVNMAQYGVVGAHTMEQFFKLEPRHQMTVTSGAAIYAPRLPDVASSVTHNGQTFTPSLFNDLPRVVKQDLNILRQSPDFLSLEIRKIINVERGTFVPPSGMTNEQFANHFAANIIDYADADNTLTEIVGTSDTVYGLEALPFISEVYVQRYYKFDAGTWNDNTDNTWTGNWVLQGTTDKTGFAIEIRNPHPRPIKVSGVYIKIAGNAETELSTLSFTPPLLNLDKLEPGGVIILYHNPNSGDPPVSNDLASVGTLFTDEAGLNHQVELPLPAVNDFDGDGTVTIELFAETTGTNIIVYQRVNADLLDDSGTRLEETVSHPSSGSPPASPANGAEGWKQRSNWGNGNGLNIITVDEDSFLDTGGFNPHERAGGLPEATLNSTSGEVSYVGVADKIATGQTDVFDKTTQQLLIRDDDKLTHVGELAHIASLGPSVNQTIAQAWGGSTSVTDFMLDFSSSDHIESNNLDVPHAMLFMDRFTTLSPLTDFVDNDDDGLGVTEIDLDELLVPGTLNLNTAPVVLLDKILPLPITIRITVAEAIANYRKSPTSSLRNSGSLKGIAYISELMNVNAVNVLAIDMSDNRTEHSTVIDFLGNPDSLTGDGIVDDREEEAMITSWLAQVASTRSDFYCAYVIIRGYPASDFKLGVVESKRFFVIFDRSAIVNGLTDQVKVLAVRDLN